MKRFSEQFHTKASTVKLRAVEREELRARVVSYMEYHPMKKMATESLAIPSRVRLLQADVFQAVQIPTSLLFRASAVFTMLLLVVVPVLAERSVPGDALYAVKVQFNEEMRSNLAFGSYQKIEWETERLNRRIAEAKLLASEGRLTQEAQIEIAAAVKEHTEEVQKEISILRAEDVDQATLASIELSTTLELQSAALQETGTTVLALAVGEVASENSAQLVVDVINQSLSSQEALATEDHIPAFDKVMARVEQNTTRAHELLRSLDLSPEEQTHKDIQRRLDDIARSIEQGKSLRNSDESQASDHLLAVLERTQKLIVYMSDIEGNRSIALNTVLPVILTPEEEQSELNALGLAIAKKSEILNLALPKVSSGAAEKIGYSIEFAGKSTKNVSADVSTSQALASARESITILDDALKIVASEGVDIASALPAPIETVFATTTASSTENTQQSTDSAQ